MSRFSEAPSGTFTKIHPFWMCQASLIVCSVSVMFSNICFANSFGSDLKGCSPGGWSGLQQLIKDKFVGKSLNAIANVVENFCEPIVDQMK